jgi:predicted dehydrogenase
MRNRRDHSSPIGLGIVGCGSVARPYAAAIRRLQADGKARAVACCDAVPKRAREYAARYGVARVVADADCLLAMPEVHAVLILTPNNCHFPIASKALAAGKHVMLEKPMATTVADARALVAQASGSQRDRRRDGVRAQPDLAPRGSKGYLVCAPFVTLSRTFQVVAQRIARGDIGSVCAARALYGWAGPDWAEWFYRKGGGALFDLGVYDLTALTGLLGPVTRVAAMAGICTRRRSVAGKRIRVEAPDNIHLILHFGDCVLGSLVTGYTIQRQRHAQVEIYGSEGVIQMLGPSWAPTGYELWQNSAGCWQVFAETDPEYHWTIGLDHLVESIATGAKPSLSPEHALHVTEIMIRALESAEAGAALDLETTFKPARVRPAHPRRVPHRVHDPTRRAEDEPGAARSIGARGRRAADARTVRELRAQSQDLE